MRALICLFSALVMFVSAQAFAQENTAVACRDRVDNDGDGQADCADLDCQYFTFCAGGATLPAATTYHQSGRLSSGWALAGGIVGFVSAGLVLTLGLTQDIAQLDYPAGLIMGSATTLLFTAVSPVTFVGGMSARRGGGVRGCVGCRIAAWIAYGLGLGGALALIGINIPGIAIPQGAVSAVTVLGTTSLTLFAVDCLVARAQVRRRQRGIAEAPRRRWALAPHVAPVVSRDGIAGGVVGVSFVR